MSDTNYCVVVTTAATSEDAKTIASALLDAKLAACIQVLDISSYYCWEGKTCNDAEKLLLIKARANLYPEIEECIVRVHTYDVPEIIQLPIEGGLQAYLTWIDDVSRTG